MPSFEFIESATMCVYGVTNVWLEHLSNPGGTWEPRDLEHVAIAFLFFGGGLVGFDEAFAVSIELICVDRNADQFHITAQSHYHPSSTAPRTRDRF